MINQRKLNSFTRYLGAVGLVAASVFLTGGSNAIARETNVETIQSPHKTVTVRGLDIFQLQDIELHLLDTGHFALKEDGDPIAGHIQRFPSSHLR